MKNIAHKPAQVRLFLVLLALAGAFCTLKFVSPHGRAGFFIAIALVCGFFIVFERLFFPVFRLIMIGSARVGQAMFLVIATVVFYLILTPLALVMRALGKSFLACKIEPGSATYFEEIRYDHDPHKQF